MGTSEVRCTKCKELSRQVGIIDAKYYCMRDYNEMLRSRNRKFGTPKPQVSGRWKKHPVFGYSVKAAVK